MNTENNSNYSMSQMETYRKSISAMGETVKNGNVIIDGSGLQRRIRTDIDTILTTPLDDERAWRNYSRIFYSNSLYKRMLKYLSTLFYNHYMITPLKDDKKVNDKKILKDYNAVLRTLDEDINPERFTKKALLDLLIEGKTFYYLEEYRKGANYYYKPIKLPTDYCRIIGTAGTPSINIFAVDLTFIDVTMAELLSKNILTEEEILKQYPKELRNAYISFKKSKRGKQWFVVPVNNGIAFTTEDGKPPFAHLIQTLARINKFEKLRDDYMATNLTKLLVQIIDIDKEGNPEVDLALAAEFHKNLREVAGKKHNVDALTTLAKEIDVLSLGETGDASKNYDFLKTYYDQYYDDAGLSEELFNASTSGTLEYSENKDEAFMYDLRLQIEAWFNYFLTTICAKKVNKNVKFVFSFLGTSYKNREKMIDSYIKGAQYGFSKLAPQIAMGVKQRFIESLVHFENDVLDLDAKLVPLQSSHTMSNKVGSNANSVGDNKNNSDVETNPNGRPSKTQDEKADITIETEASK